ncbi:hypothetical protein IMW75_13505 [Pseudomonas gregormendelii]|uniref:Uncharacterized protein n=1 Tax=Pseudomonas gregormendelii TaxID=1628277 RepID=A0ABS3AH84_9PSED|nr:hypothetical protein [Pseudomonas gregormendelii]MBN3966288.1 hypothetical protein [Pseudomonas gregormendelii]
MTDVTDKIIAKLNEQKGEIIATQALLLGMLRSLPAEVRTDAIREFDVEIATARSTLSYLPVPDEVINGLENYVKALNHIRVSPNQD